LRHSVTATEKAVLWLLLLGITDWRGEGAKSKIEEDKSKFKGRVHPCPKAST
jgi:hypothetical protein